MRAFLARIFVNPAHSPGAFFLANYHDMFIRKQQSKLHPGTLLP